MTWLHDSINFILTCEKSSRLTGQIPVIFAPRFSNCWSSCFVNWTTSIRDAGEDDTSCTKSSPLIFIRRGGMILDRMLSVACVLQTVRGSKSSGRSGSFSCFLVTRTGFRYFTRLFSGRTSFCSCDIVRCRRGSRNTLESL